jgi:predicted nucleic acid-binding protein
VNYLLDACALIAFIKQEPEGLKVKEVVERSIAGDATLFMSIVNLTEVYYIFIRDDGQEIADTIMQSVDALPVTVIDTIGQAVYRDAARMKVRYSMSFADTFLCATAKSINATIVTKDSEIADAEKAEPFSVFWIK